MLRYRLWLVLIGYLIVAAALQAGSICSARRRR